MSVEIHLVCLCVFVCGERYAIAHNRAVIESIALLLLMFNDDLSLH